MVVLGLVRGKGSMAFMYFMGMGWALSALCWQLVCYCGSRCSLFFLYGVLWAFSLLIMRGENSSHEISR